MTTLPAIPNESDAFFIKEAILDELGQWAFEQLCKALGGQQIDVPGNAATITEGHYIARAIGLENARILAEAIGPARYYVPQFRPRRDERLLDLVRQGYANWEIAGMLRHSERHVRRCLSHLGVSNPNRKPRNLFLLPGSHHSGSVALVGRPETPRAAILTGG